MTDTEWRKLVKALKNERGRLKAHIGKLKGDILELTGQKDRLKKVVERYRN